MAPAAARMTRATTAACVHRTSARTRRDAARHAGMLVRLPLENLGWHAGPCCATSDYLTSGPVHSHRSHVAWLARQQWRVSASAAERSTSNDTEQRHGSEDSERRSMAAGSRSTKPAKSANDEPSLDTKQWQRQTREPRGRAATSRRRNTADATSNETSDAAPQPKTFHDVEKLRREAKRGRLSKQVVATLEMVYTRTRFPSDEVIRSLYDLHKVPRKQALEWFAARRRADRESRPQDVDGVKDVDDVKDVDGVQDKDDKP